MQVPMKALRALCLTAAAAALIVGAGCGGSSTVSGSSVGPALDQLRIHVTGSAESHSSAECFLRLESKVVGGGTMTYCLETFTGRPGPDAVVKSSGTAIFALPEGQIRSDVDVEQRFGPEGKHAHQKLTGSVTGGTRTYEGVRGTISGGGANVEFPPGTITNSDLRYLIRFG